MAKELRIGLIGCGSQGRTLSTVLGRIDGCKLIAVADVNETIAKQFAEEFKVENYYRDHYELLEKVDVDAVLVAIPHFALKNVSIDCLEAGKPTFVEKPMAKNSIEAKELVKAVERSGATLMVGYCQRFLASRSLMKSFLDKGIVGEVSLILAVKGTGLLRGWLLEEPKGGGILRYLGVHLIDQVLWMVGSKAEEVLAEVNVHPTFGVDETVSFIIRFKNSVLASLSLTMRASKSIDSVEVIGSDGHMKSEWRDNYLLVHSSKMIEYANPTTIRFMEDPTYPMFERELREFIASVIENRMPSINVLDGLRVLEVVDAVLESAQLKRAVKIPHYS